MIRNMRSLLYLPGNKQRFIDKSATVPCDAVIFDLEDSVSLEHKDEARRTTIDALVRFEKEAVPAMRIVRINAFDTLLAYRDLMAVAPYKPDAVIVPKADARSILLAENLLSAVEKECSIAGISLIGLIETARGMTEIKDILSVTDRLIALQFGAEDYTRDMGVEKTALGLETENAKRQMALFCHAYGREAIDTPYTAINNPDGLKAELRASRAMGFTGKTAIHPDQVPIINDAFYPTPEQIEQAKRIVAVYKEAVAQGMGSVKIDGAMVDLPVADRASRLLESCAQYSHKKEG